MKSTDSPIIPMSFSKSLLYFFIPAFLITLNMWIIMGLFADLGLSTFLNYIIIYATIPMLLFIFLSIVFYKRDGYELTWDALKSRFRLNKMNKLDWVWSIGLFLFMFLSAMILSVTSPYIANIIQPPPHWPEELNPLLSKTNTATLPTTFMGEPLAGNWSVLGLLLISLIIATLGEEFWWRGYILPRQEAYFGKNTWIIHGLLWTGFHIFSPWNLIAVLSGALALSYVVQKRKNTVPAIIAHGLANGFFVILVVLTGIIA